MKTPTLPTAEHQRLAEDKARARNWKRWGPYLSERQWGTVREDYSDSGDCWNYFPHDHARSRAYRWGEDGLLGITDRECRLCFSLALWNGRDPILKERLYGLTGPEGNHGEDVKEEYFYLDSTPTHSFMRALYKYPQAEFPYGWLLDENRRRSKQQPEFELKDTGVFNDNRYFDVEAQYAKADADDILIRVRITNRGPETATLHVLPQLWFRNSWSWGCKHEGCGIRPDLSLQPDGSIRARHTTLGEYRFEAEGAERFLFTNNDSNQERLWNTPNPQPHVKDAFHRYVVNGDTGAVSEEQRGTKAAALYRLTLAPGQTKDVRLRLYAAGARSPHSFGPAFDATFEQRASEADSFYSQTLADGMTQDERRVARQAFAGLLWSKQFFHYVVEDWLDGDSDQPAPPESRKRGRNSDWRHLYNRDVISMPDAWEYPWYAAWDLAFHMIPMAKVDPQFAKDQLLLFLREWYMHPNGQIPAYEFAFGDVNPPVHAWAVWRVYKISDKRDQRDVLWLKRCFQKLLLNFNWWVNRKDPHGNHIFGGGFLGMDNIGVFDRSQPLPTGGHLEQADGTAWMAFYCSTMLAIALELAMHDASYEDMASKFFEHFVAIADAINKVGGSGLWNNDDGFYYDHLHVNGKSDALKIRSLVGLVPLLAVEPLEQHTIDALPGFKKRLEWFLENRRDLAGQISYMASGDGHGEHRLLAIPTRERLESAVRYLLDEGEFLSPHGIRSLSRVHADKPYEYRLDGNVWKVEYTPGESNSGLFGGNSNWRGPIWFPINFLLVEALERYGHFFEDSLTVELPTGSGHRVTLQQAARELSRRLSSLFIADERGRRPVHGDDARYATDDGWKDLVLFYEYFHGDTGRGVGASHQTGWTALAATLIQERARGEAAAHHHSSHLSLEKHR
ncbi:MAG: glucosidase [Acidobacteriota bacterium]